MGQAFGCCGTNDGQDMGNVTTTGGTVSQDKMLKIIKMQALVRGFLARRRFARHFGQTNSQGRAMMHHDNFSGPANYENPDVIVREAVFSFF